METKPKTPFGNRQLDLQAAALEAAGNAIVITDRAGIIQWVNPAFTTLTGYSAAEVLGQNPRLLKSGQHDARFYAAMWNTISSGATWHGEIINKRKDGSLYVEKLTITSVQSEDGEISHFVGVKEDITARKHAERALRESEQRLRAMFDNAGVGVVEVDANDRFIAVNERVCQILGYRAEELLSMTVHDLTAPEDRSRNDELHRRLRDGSLDRFENEKRYLRRDGSPLWVHVTVSAVRNGAGKYLYCIATVEDFSERKDAERRIQELNDALKQRNAELEAERARWQGVVEGIADEVWICDADGKMTLVNLPAVTQMRLQEFKDKNIQEVLETVDILYPDLQPRPPEQSPLLRSLRGDLVRGEEIMRDRRTGNMRYRQFSSAPTRDATGSITGAVAIVRDITEHKNAEEARKESEATLRAVFNSVYDGIILHATDGTIFDVNDRMLVMYGMTRDDLPRTTIAALSSPSSPIASLPLIWSKVIGGTPQFFEWKARRLKDGFEFDVEVFLRRIRVQGRDAVLANVRDITDRKRSRQELIDAKELAETRLAQLRATVNSMSEGVYVCDLQAKPLLVNPAFLRIYGCDADAMPESTRALASLLEVYDSNGRCVPYPERPIPAALRGEIVSHRELHVVRRDTGKKMVLSHNAVPIRDSSGRIIMAVLTVEDISTMKQAEQALVRSEKLASVGRMAATIAHEINNPLAAVMNTLFIARDNAGIPDSVRQYLDIADEELRRISHITRQALGFYRESTLPAVTSIRALLHSAVDIMKSKIKAKRVRVGMQCEVDFEVLGVSGELRQVFANLLSNSLDAVGENGRITLRVSRSRCISPGREYVRVTVADDGRGIDSAARPHIFEPFFTTKDAIGTGLGLWVSKQIVDKHNGSMRVHSNTKGSFTGTTISIILPAAARNDVDRMAAVS